MNYRIPKDRLAQADGIAVAGMVGPTLHAGGDSLQGDVARLVSQEQSI